MKMNKKSISILFLLLLLIIIIVLLSKPNIENFQTNKTRYVIDFDNETKPSHMYNIVSKTMGDNVSGFNFNGVNSYIEIPNMDLDVFTISMIVYMTNMDKKQYLMSGDMEVYVENGQLYMKHKNQKTVFKNGIEVNKYNHLAFKIQNKKLIVFFDGTEIEYDFTNKINYTTLNIGTNNIKDTFFKGLIGEIKVFSSVKTNSDLCKLHDACQLQSCKFDPNGESRDECYKNCIDSKDNDCNDEACTKKCLNESTSNWKPPCEFKPYGSDIFSCMNFCVTKNNCNYKNCQQLCESCDDVDVCPWIAKKPNVKNKPVFKPVDTSKLNGEPLPPKIFVLPYNGKFLIKWTPPNKYEGQEGDIEEYVCFVYKTLNKAEGVQMSKVPFPECKDCKFVVDELDLDTYYSVGIRAYNKKGLSKMSNLVSMKPKYKKNIKKTDDRPKETATTVSPPLCPIK